MALDCMSIESSRKILIRPRISSSFLKYGKAKFEYLHY